MSQQHLNEHGVYDPPTPRIAGDTVVHDRKRNTQVMRIQGVVVLPLGSEFELANPNVTAIVTGVRLLAGAAVAVCLDVDVPGEYWGE